MIVIVYYLVNKSLELILIDQARALLDLQLYVYFMKDDNQKNDSSPHILNASSNLLGLCFVVLTSLKILKFSNTTLIDELTIVATILFMISCILSFLSIRGDVKRYENIADVAFLLGLSILFVTTILFSFNIIA